ncbi:ABC transporter permease subunit [Herbidospora sp. NEAU-GS84]|uniref:ABC transporter permease subunit n=1 Tax=Herbidospora solisilvae TaxID=2696284 RepID=A0A7C9NLM5_9ACTN|nr:MULTISPECIES: carbohydrate ABC transporter permease [Herbidospora]NAS26398.1 ABC transporter permease subunit [Herbidospora solisilvae]GLX97213.1 sn-glycerol-3-phosphate transport system permease protein UgpE [Herbidospora sp. NBRC 101105]
MTRYRLAFAITGAVAMLFPVYWMVVTAISSSADMRGPGLHLWPTSVRWENLTDPLSKFPYGMWAVNSVFIAVVAVVLTVVINLMAGYAFAKLRFPGRNVLFILIISTLMVPVQVVMVPQFHLVVDFGLIGSDWGVIVPRLAEAFGLFMARQFMMAIPDELIEAAQCDGSSQWRIFRTVVLPLCRPLIAVLVIFTFMWRWNEFAWPLIVLKDPESYTLQVGLLFLKNQYGQDYGSLMAMSLLSMIPMIIVFALFQRHFVEGMARSGIK